MKFFLSKWALCFLCLLMLACSSCGPNENAVSGPVEQPGVIDTKPLEPKPPVTKPVVPDVVGQTAPDAMAAIVVAGGLKLGTFTYEHSDTVALGRVTAQRPPAGTSVPAGSSVRLVVSLGPHPAEETPPAKPVVEKPTETPIEKPTETPVVEKPTDGPNIVARIGEYTFTKQELENRLVTELRVRPEECMNADGTVNPEPVLLKMLGEKAMIMDAREQKLLEKDNLALRRFNLFKKEVLAGLLWQKEVADKIKVSEAEIDAKIKSDPKLKGNRAQARKVLAQAKNRTLTEKYYKQLYEKLNVQKVSSSFREAARIYRRLLIESRETEKLVFVRRTQIEALPPEEKNMALAKFEGGQITLEDLLWVLHGIGPNSRPRNLHTPKGVEKFLDRIMRQPVFVAEAKLQGLDKQEGYLKPVREREDRELRGKATRAAYDRATKPTEDELRPYFDANKDKFETPDRLKIDQIWCQDLATAQKAKAELSSGKDFASVKQAYSLAKKEKALSTSASREGMFFEQLWNAEPNEIVGPIKGFYVHRRARQVQWQIKWRIVKILAKTLGKDKEYSSSIEEKVSNMIRSERRAAALIKHQEDLLQKHSYKIYHERIKDINPLNIP